MSKAQQSGAPPIPSQIASRREFLKKTTTVAATTAAVTTRAPRLSLARSAHVAGTNTVKIGLIGCGGRGTGAAIQAMNTKSGNVQLVAMADAFQDRADLCKSQAVQEHKDNVLVDDKNIHVGLDGYKKVIESDADLIILATPPGFRPLHFAAAVEAGKHVFMEKPVAVDVPGIRKVLKYGEIALEKNLLVQVGLQRRHERAYQSTIEKLQDGIIGDLLYSRVYWNSRGVWEKPRQPNDSELNYQMRNWYYFNWLCGDQIVEQHIHNLDVINWLMDGYPEKAQGQGGRQVRVGIDNGEIYDHHFVEYTYANGHKMFSQCRHMPDCYNEVSEHVVGTKGYANISDGRIFTPDGTEIFKSKEGAGQRAGHQQEHHDLFADLAQGGRPNEVQYGAESTMTAILGRLCTYTGKELYWEDAINSEVSLAANIEEILTLDAEPPIHPDEDGRYKINQPGSCEGVIDWKPRKSAKEIARAKAREERAKARAEAKAKKDKAKKEKEKTKAEKMLK